MAELRDRYVPLAPWIPMALRLLSAMAGTFFALLGVPSIAQIPECEVRSKNMGVLREGESYGHQPSGGRIGPERTWGGWGFRGGLGAPNWQVVDDSSRREPDYLVDAIASITDLVNADKQAEALEHRGQYFVARKIRERMRLACSEIYGRKLSTQ